jgi:hypothetical protein
LRRYVRREQARLGKGSEHGVFPAVVAKRRV